MGEGVGVQADILPSLSRPETCRVHPLYRRTFAVGKVAGLWSSVRSNMFVTEVIRGRNFIQSLARWIYYKLSVVLNPNLIISSRIRVCEIPLSLSAPQDIPTNNLYVCLISFMRIVHVQTISFHSSASSFSSELYFFVIILSGVRLSPLGTAATIGLLYPPQMIDDGDCGAIGRMKIGRGNSSSRRKPAPETLCPPQIPHDLTRARTRAVAMGASD
jgi:hypothetical protein